jgi:hypothetical protein
MPLRSTIARIPFWVRVPGIIALVLAGVLITTMLLDAGGGDGAHGSGGGHGSGRTTEMTDRSGADGHGDSEGTEAMDHPDDGAHGSQP